MEHIAALLFVVSCSQDLSGCREIPAPTPLFEVFEDCQAELPKAIGILAPQYPRILAKCLEVDPALEDDYNQLTWNVLPNGTLDASLSVTSVIAASEPAQPGEAYLH
ncbi:hypothetical protein ACFFTN_20805 [Aminobacter aganoensis]|uniref:Uncharacterized protein n=1 Tax=Aminobacter aganoensis TaxID=83264 RepID=A0A7X0FC77_9HYPH|nr:MULTISPECIES: hypothetical protein [Aminobacter]KQU72826.1 hypothetical protein ASC75_03845 [Aminobacter sp. DSM 101952]MBB6356996.1 hypothetical protein [Aminobacter aganoensis]